MLFVRVAIVSSLMSHACVVIMLLLDNYYIMLKHIGEKKVKQYVRKRAQPDDMRAGFHKRG